MTSPPVELTDDELREGLTACLAVPRWVDEVAAAAPFGSMTALLDAAAAAANPLTADEVDQALASHPRIGERPTGSGSSASFSRAEQASSSSSDADLAEALAAGNRAYEDRFGRVFLIRAAGRSRPQILAELQRRLQLDDHTEIAIVASELRDIALLRIPQLFAHLDHHSGYNLPEAAE
ncbi:2-oxo-4-hydroxy-4-carboxy-5-ureidoimidazoline decarboxylase [uncultured Friedmanniella sp.]|uniref:2-oxo-4-hydroxy-4-carboxy-5-ureidoimidazoline decarboxylase n=1 Tax=uncultured Friedmanniella sp. TaxID=335381 RepID=UPI0035C971E4